MMPPPKPNHHAIHLSEKNFYLLRLILPTGTFRPRGYVTSRPSSETERPLKNNRFRDKARVMKVASYHFIISE